MDIILIPSSLYRITTKDQCMSHTYASGEGSVSQLANDMRSREVGEVRHTDIQDCISFMNVGIMCLCVLGQPVCIGVTQHPCVCSKKWV